MATILTKKSDTASAVPLAADLTNATGGAELAVNATDKRLFSKTSGGSVVELGTNPSSLTMPNGTANGLAFLNASKVVTSGSALTWNGSTLLVGGNTRFGSGAVIPGFATASDASLANNASLRGTNAAGATAFELIKLNTSDQVVINNDGADAVLTSAATSQRWLIGSEQMRLTSTGLGIGTSSPAYKLDVRTSGTNTVAFIVTSAGGGSLINFSDGNTSVQPQFGALANNLTFKTNNAEQMRLDSSGNLGLGVTPSAWNSDYKALNYGSAGLLYGRVGSQEVALGTNWYRNSAGSFLYSTTGFASYYAQVGSTHSWWTAPSGTAGNAITFTQALTLDSSGNLLLGATSQFNVGKQCIAFNGNTNYGISLKDTVDQATARFIGFINGSGTVIGSVDRVTTTNAVIYNTTSDYRLKTVTGAVTGQGERIDALNPIDYLWKDDGQQARGFLAHEFQTVYPNSVTGDKDAVDANGNPVYQAMQASTAEVIADLVAEIKSLRQRVATLEAK